MTRMLAIDTATEVCSLALFEEGELVGFRHELLGRGHAEQLVPFIASLPGKGRASYLRVSLGPGSFTGVRIGLAAARALALAWDSELCGYPTLALVAATARQSATGPISVCMAGGHGEWFVQDFDAQLLPLGEPASLAPEATRGRFAQPVIAGNRASEKASLEGSDHLAIEALPDARCVLSLPPALLTPSLTPVYARGPDARLPNG